MKKNPWLNSTASIDKSMNEKKSSSDKWKKVPHMLAGISVINILHGLGVTKFIIYMLSGNASDIEAHADLAAAISLGIAIGSYFTGYSLSQRFFERIAESEISDFNKKTQKIILCIIYMTIAVLGATLSKLP